jgi:hypothetical protein
MDTTSIKLTCRSSAKDSNRVVLEIEETYKLALEARFELRPYYPIFRERECRICCVLRASLIQNPFRRTEA